VGEKIGLVGVGLMGSAMSEQLIGAGYEVQGFDIDAKRLNDLEERGGVAVSSPGAAIEGARAVILSLMTSNVIEEVCFGAGGIVEAKPSDLLVIDTSTSRPEDSVANAEKLREKGVAFVDASLSGSSPMIRTKNIVAMVGGEKADYERAKPILEKFARSVYHLGANGAGARTKLIVNLILGLNRMAVAEGLCLGMKSGMDMEILLTVLKDSFAYSKAMENRGERMINADYDDPMSRLFQHHKDVGLMLEQGQNLGSPMPLLSALKQVLVSAEATGLGQLDTSSIIEVLRRGAGIPSR
jgi:3-hydroxyisobutyrate dehydrogenase-like beta-hydroxyacid dehydrogenase